jgi:hypothetical protein
MYAFVYDCVIYFVSFVLLIFVAVDYGSFD